MKQLILLLFIVPLFSTTLFGQFAEKLITLAKKGTLASRRQAISMLGNRAIVTEENGKVVKTGTVISKLFSDIAPRYLDRPGGYTRIIRLALRRLGDNGQLVLLQLLGEDESVKKKAKKTTKKKATSRKKKVSASPAMDD